MIELLKNGNQCSKTKWKVHVKMRIVSGSARRSTPLVPLARVLIELRVAGASVGVAVSLIPSVIHVSSRVTIGERARLVVPPWVVLRVVLISSSRLASKGRRSNLSSPVGIPSAEHSSWVMHLWGLRDVRRNRILLLLSEALVLDPGYVGRKRRTRGNRNSRRRTRKRISGRLGVLWPARNTRVLGQRRRRCVGSCHVLIEGFWLINSYQSALFVLNEARRSERRPAVQLL